MKAPFRLITLLAIAAGLFAGCNEKEDEPEADATVEEYTVAIVLPMDDSYAPLWQHTVQMFDENLQLTLNTASLTHQKTVKFNYEWYDEDAVDLKRLAVQLSSREDLLGIIGPMVSGNVDIFAGECVMRNTLIFSPVASSAEVVRKYSSSECFFNLCETDISQCEQLLTYANEYGAKDVSLLAASSMYGQTFIDWFPFQAEELGIKVGNLYIYDDEVPGDLEEKAAQAMNGGNDCLICVPTEIDDVRRILAEKQKAEKQPWTLFSDIAFSPPVLDYEGAEGIEGTGMYSDPESGFERAYSIRFQEVSVSGQSQVYDALMLMALGQMEVLNGKSTDIVQGVRKMLQNNYGVEFLTWNGEGMSRVLEGISKNRYYNLRGASGNLNFDTENGSVVTNTLYCRWMIYNGAFLALDYRSSDGSLRSSPTLASWNWQVTKFQEFDDSQTFSYPSLKNNYALLIAASTGWNNYRHQADVLDLYQVLRSTGFDDDHIILIMEDDLADNPSNPYPGEIRREDGVKLNSNILIDYRLSELTPDDIEAILDGRKSDRLPNVIESGPQDNVLVFWSGHGRPGALLWNENEEDDCFTYERMARLLETLSENARYRKLLWLIETCYSGSVAKAAEGVPGVLCLTAANATETSKASIYNIDYGTYMTNRYSEILIGLLNSMIEEDKDLCMRDLYYYLTNYTLGSHVTCVNASAFDNLYRSGFREFVIPLK